MSIGEFIWKGKTITVPLIVLLIAAITLLTMGYNKLAWKVFYAGTLIAGLGNLAYIVFWHSRKKWPNCSWHERLEKVFTSQE